MSERELTAEVKDELEKGTVRIAALVELQFDGGFVRLWSGPHPLLVDFGSMQAGFQADAFQSDAFQQGEFVSGESKLFLGVGDYGGIDAVRETANDVRANGLALTLSGIPQDKIALCLTEFFVNRPATVWIAFFDAAWQIIPSAIQVFKGRMDYPVIDEGGETSTITVHCESILIDLERPRVRRYTDADQRSEYPDDAGLQYVVAIQNVDIVWKS